MEDKSTKTLTSKIELGIAGNLLPASKELTRPYFFIKWAQNDKRYRVSASFKYLNTTYGLHINIIRDFNKIGENSNGDNHNKIKFLLSLLNKLEPYHVSDDLSYTRYLDKLEHTEIFYIQRNYNGNINPTVVFFSLECWSLNDYLDYLIGKEN